MDARASALSVETLGGTVGQAKMAIRLRPRDTHGNFLGADAAHEIDATVAGVRLYRGALSSLPRVR